MSVMYDDSQVNSSSSNDFAAVLDTELDSTSDTSPEQKEDANETYDHMDINRCLLKLFHSKRIRYSNH